ncbi:MAG: NAD(P)H-dependent oxidoreductase [Gammaproteobacteria bacterium]
MKLLMFAASLQNNSVNKKLINLTAKICKESDHFVDLADFSEFDMPLYNADIQNHQGFPAAVTSFIERMHKADALIISSPEYNFSTPGTLKNLIDWVSRVTPMPWHGQRILLLSASPALVGGNRGLWATRVPLECCGALVYPDMFSLASAHEAFDEEGNLKHRVLQQRLDNMLKEFFGMVGKLGVK